MLAGRGSVPISSSMSVSVSFSSRRRSCLVSFTFWGQEQPSNNLNSNRNTGTATLLVCLRRFLAEVLLRVLWKMKSQQRAGPITEGIVLWERWAIDGLADNSGTYLQRVIIGAESADYLIPGSVKVG